MAWRSTGRTNAELIANMAQNGIFHSERVAAAMAKVDRANYVLNKRDAYEDAPQRIGHGATISAPHMHAHAAEHLLPFLYPGARVLDIGSGSGYLAAVFYHLVAGNASPTTPGPDADAPVLGKVTAVEHIPELAAWSVENLRRDGLGPALAAGTIEVIVGDGRLGRPNGGPYDAIHVGAAAPTLPPALVEQLAAPGRMFIPLGTAWQSVWIVEKDSAGAERREELMGVVYVPLTDREAQDGSR